MPLTKAKPNLWARDVMSRWNPPTIPELQGFTTLYGVRVCSVGPDEDLVALGHVGKLRALAAFNAYARKEWGFGADRTNGDCGPSPSLYEQAGYSGLDEALDNVAYEWRTNDAPVNDWILRHAANERVMGAFPVTVWRV